MIDAFDNWVANTVAELGGIGRTFTGVETKLVPTTAETGVDACQCVFDVYFVGKNSDSMRATSRVTTNNVWLH